MERLTAPQWSNRHYHIYANVYPKRKDMEHDFQRIVDRLGQYEGTGLTPEEIKEVQAALDKIPFGRFREIMEAERDGRCVVLPVKVGTRLWHIYDRDAGAKECYASEENIFLVYDRLGSTVFLTKEAAENALKGRDDNDRD